MSGIFDIGLRVGLVAAGLVLWFWTQRLISRKPAPAGVVGDRLHAWTAPLHDWLAARRGPANATLIVSSACIDLFGIYLLGAAIFGPTLRPFIALLAVFLLRQMFQGLCTLPTPPGMIWRRPGFPALLVTYDVGNDFFFSGHTAIAFVGAMELWHAAPLWVAGVALAVACLEGATVIVLRAHYTMDVFAAAAAALVCEAFAGRVAPTVDAWLNGWAAWF